MPILTFSAMVNHLVNQVVDQVHVASYAARVQPIG